jgi:hypothetical protein
MEAAIRSIHMSLNCIGHGILHQSQWWKHLIWLDERPKNVCLL